MPLDPAAAALLGTVAGGDIGVVGTIINARAAAKQSAAG